MLGFGGGLLSKMASYGLQRQETNLKTVFAQPSVPVGLARNNVLHIEFDNSNHWFIWRNDTPERIILLDKLLIVDFVNSTTEIIWLKAK